MNTLEELFQELTSDAKQQVEDWTRFLLRKHSQQDATDPSRTDAIKDQPAPYAATLPELVQSLPLEMQQQVQQFVEFLLEKETSRPRGKPTLEWAGALRDLRDQYTSVELQHAISNWRIKESSRSWVPTSFWKSFWSRNVRQRPSLF